MHCTFARSFWMEILTETITIYTFNGNQTGLNPCSLDELCPSLSILNFRRSFLITTKQFSWKSNFPFEFNFAFSSFTVFCQCQNTIGAAFVKIISFMTKVFAMRFSKPCWWTQQNLWFWKNPLRFWKKALKGENEMSLNPHAYWRALTLLSLKCVSQQAQPQIPFNHSNYSNYVDTFCYNLVFSWGGLTLFIAALRSWNLWVKSAFEAHFSPATHLFLPSPKSE